MSAPVTAEELAEIERLDREATPGPWRRWAQPEGVACFWKDALPPGSICLESTGTVFALGVAVAAIPEGCDADSQIVATSRDLMPRLARDLAAERETSKRLADCVLDLGRELEALRAAVRVHEERRRAGWPTPNPWNQADLDLWAAGKA